MEAEEQRKGAEEILYKTKVVQFLGRATPIVLQNDNGPCPLLAICKPSPSPPPVPPQAIECGDKDDGYVTNQRQNISDAIDLLPRLATGIDVNLHFRKCVPMLPSVLVLTDHMKS
ncbi:hypothetical protein BHE74_00045595 [Ensete ventricosum]|nr:hypothetical protein GW17_00024737 [Ensete ventricosum]RWW48332.1 hypothetical protein BHE74_00045595 [Ensete ventricosum]RZS09038.1 hypothetical protein BHM03_00040077 [Ensete ventricosum]